ncbi:MAG: branched-chain amino acid ABC transporter permease [Firmicutes bacterium]|jgi:branched-chain amino acid transport system permease protein|nr:branched-chain amino acid ABC transporter permease [Bacillota bacterium]
MDGFRVKFIRGLGVLGLSASVAWVLASAIRARLPNYITGLLTVVAINSVTALGWNLVSGFTGQFNLGHAGFMAAGGYTSAILMIRLKWPFPVSFICGAAFAGFLGFLVGFPSLRLVGDYLAIVTLGFQYIILAVLNNTTPLTGGGLGLAGVPFRTHLPTATLTVVVTLWLLSNLVRSKQGRCFVAVKEDEIAAQSVGINTTYYKVLAFIISSMLAGLAGSLLGHFMMYLHPDIFNYLKTIESVSMVILGGLGSLTGSIVGALCITLVPEVFRNLATFVAGFGLMRASDFLRRGWMVFYALLFVVMMLARPRGLMGGRELTWEGVRSFAARLVTLRGVRGWPSSKSET